MEEERINPSPLKKPLRFPGRPLLTPVPESPRPAYASVAEHQQPVLDTESVMTVSTGPKTPTFERPSEPVPRMHDSPPKHAQLPEVVPISPMTLPDRLSKRISSVQKRSSMEIPRIVSSDLQNQSVPRNRAQSLDNPTPYSPIPNLSIIN